MSDAFKTVLGIGGTAVSWTLIDLSHVAAIAAGLTTAAWMVVQIYHKIKDRKRDDSESGE